MTRPTPKIAVTGVASFLGARLLQRLVETAGPGELLAIDIASPPAALGVRHLFLDLTQPAADQRLLDLLKDEGVDTVVHMAFFTSPRRDAAYAHELESIGTLSVLAAAAAAGVRHVLMRSFTAVYGARGQNPSFLGEDQPLQPNASLRWVRDKVEAETHAASFGKRYPEMTVTVLRLAPLMGPGVRTFYTRIFDKRVVPTLMGYDPLMQALHPEDALTAIETTLEHRRGGVFNVVPRSAIPLASAIHLCAKVPVPVPHPIAYAASDLLWSTGLAEAPGAFLDYVRYPVVADGAKAKRELGFEARYSSREAVQGYLRYRHPEGAPRAAEARA
jgi:UDP-glucose 4-epimerase